jgi:hypothetical protein
MRTIAGFRFFASAIWAIFVEMPLALASWAFLSRRLAHAYVWAHDMWHEIGGTPKCDADTKLAKDIG